jgi:hypothetical protein
MIVRLARENSRWGYGKIEGELLKLGFTVSASTVGNVLNRHGILPAPVRHGSIGWRHLMRHYKQQLLACDFFTNDSKFTAPFDTVFQSEGLRVIRTPFQAPNANAYAERWVRSVREECLDHIPILSQTHLRSVLNTYIDYYNTARPHQGLAQQSAIPHRRAHESGPIQRREVLGGITGDDYRVPGNTVPAVG